MIVAGASARNSQRPAREPNALYGLGVALVAVVDGPFAYEYLSCNLCIAEPENSMVRPWSG